LDTHEQMGMTDGNGEVTFRISSPGTWIIGLRDFRTSTFQGVKVTENHDSLTVFNVLK
jgi:hypothetical protein